MKRLQEVEKIEFTELLRDFSIMQYKQGFEQYLNEIFKVSKIIFILLGAKFKKQQD